MALFSQENRDFKTCSGEAGEAVIRMAHVLDYPLAKRLARNGVPIARVLYRAKSGAKIWTTAWWAFNEDRQEYCWHRVFDDYGPLGNVIDVDQFSMDEAAAIAPRNAKRKKPPRILRNGSKSSDDV